MEGSRKSKTTNQNQFIKLVETMEKNPDIARGFPSVGKNKDSVNLFWKELSVILNCLGPAVKDCVEWRKVWNDFKRHIKQKIAMSKKELTGTGGGPSNSQFSLSPLEQQTDALLKISSSGAPSGKSFGPKEAISNRGNTVDPETSIDTQPSLPELCTDIEVINYLDESNNEENMQNLNNTQIQSNRPRTNTTRPKTKANPGIPEIEKQRVKLLEKQTKNQTEILEILKKIEKNTNNQQYYSKKMYELKKREVEILQEQFKAQQKNELHKQKVNFEKLKVKKRKLVLEERKLGIQQTGSSSDSD